MSKSSPSEVKLAVSTSGGFFRLKSLNLQVFVMIAAVIAIMLLFTWTTDGAYLSARDVSNLLRQTATTGILAVGMVSVTISAEIDLSVDSMMGLLGGVVAICDVWLGWPLSLTTIATSVLGLPLGIWGGWWVAYHKAPSFTVTLVSMSVFRDILIGITNDMTVSPISAVVPQIGQSYLSASTGFIISTLSLIASIGWQRRGRMRRQTLGLQSPASTAVVGHQALTAIIILGAIWLPNDYRGVSAPVLLLTLLLLDGMLVATRTVFGRRIYTIGDNLETVRLSGINVERVKLAVSVINGLMVAITELTLSSRPGAGSPSMGDIAELGTITACIIGGTSLVDDAGSVAGTVIGAFIVASLDNGMSMMDVPTFWQCIVKGVILLLAVWINSTTRRHS